MSLLFPELRGYYAFLDHAARPSGGASQLVNSVRSFIAAGVENRLVALFDNDTEGQAQLEVLTRRALPANVRALTYPEIALARTYPTVGPNGNATQDVNGAAGSIEIYFGEDVLRDETGRLAPVHWTSRKERTGRYQGEVEGKDNLKQRFIAKAERSARDANAINEDDWREMRLLLGHVFRAFA